MAIIVATIPAMNPIDAHINGFVLKVLIPDMVNFQPETIKLQCDISYLYLFNGSMIKFAEEHHFIGD
jgi:hypothetical protein